MGAVDLGIGRWRIEERRMRDEAFQSSNRIFLIDFPPHSLLGPTFLPAVLSHLNAPSAESAEEAFRRKYLQYNKGGRGIIQSWPW